MYSSTIDPGQIQPLEVQPARLEILMVEFRVWLNFMDSLKDWSVEFREDLEKILENLVEVQIHKIKRNSHFSKEAWEVSLQDSQ